MKTTTKTRRTLIALYLTVRQLRRMLREQRRQVWQTVDRQTQEAAIAATEGRNENQ